MITSLANPKVKYIRRLQNERRFRQKEQLFIFEGTRWLKEFLSTPLRPTLIFYTAVWQERHDPILQQLDVPIQIVTPEVMSAISDTETPQGVLGVVPIQPISISDQPSLLLLLDAVTNPGNLGTMLRSAAAAGVDGVLLSPGCVDPYNPKVIRGGMGAHLRLPIHQANWDTIGQQIAHTNVWVASAEGEQTYTAVSWQTPSTLIIGGEANGATEQSLNLATGKIAIPMHAATESLNAAVAASVILFEAARQRA